MVSYDNKDTVRSIVETIVNRRSDSKQRKNVEEGENDDDDDEISRLVDEGKPIGSPRSNNEEESN